MTDYTELKKPAGDATPGPWSSEPGNLVVCPGNDVIAVTNNNCNAAFIAAADPQTVIGLAKELMDLKFARDTAYKLLNKNELLSYALIMAKRLEQSHS